MRKYHLLTVRFFLFCLLIANFSSAISQETSSTLNGVITDPKGAPITGASIIVQHMPTGYKTGTQTNNKGIFVLPNLKPGGPYTITISYTGFKTETLENINLSLGTNPDADISLKQDDKSLQEVVVMGGKRPATAGFTVGKAQLSTLPTLGRSLGDFTRLTPQSNNNAFAGTNFRYNNITLDGAANNDAIGFSNSFGGVSGGGQSGTAGSGSRTNPYSLDVIQEVQVQIAPYDVKLGNFTGGSVNAVTKSGGNDFHGSVYGYGRNQSLVGKSVDGLKKSIGSNFYDYQYGATISGPIIRNKLFFIINGEITRRQEPTFYNAGDPGAAMTIAEGQQIVNFLKTNYNYDPGTYGAYKIQTNSNKLFARVDYNINSKSTLTVRAIVTHGYGQNLERSSTNFQFSNFDFTQHSKNLNMVAELKTKVSRNLSNQLIVSYINVHDYRDVPGVLAPMMDIDNGRIWVGSWREASVYNNKQKTIEITNNVTLTSGINKFTFGTHNELYDITYGFVNSWNGRWEYANGLTSFLNSQPTRIRGGFPFDNSKNNRDGLNGGFEGAEFKINFLSVYGQDEISLSKKLKISPGLRIDYAYMVNKLPLDPQLNTTPDYISPNPTYRHTPFSQLNNDYLNKPTFSPRFGFNYDVKGNQSLVIRGGTGIFVGKIPFAWLGNASTLTGTHLGVIDYKPGATSVPLAINPLYLKDTVSKYGGTGATATREVDIVDNKFKMPAIWRSNVAVDVKFGNGYKATFDVLYTKTLQDVKFQQINIKDSVQYYSNGPTQSPVYVGGKLNKNYSNIYMLTNTTEGYRYNLTAQLSKLFSRGKVNYNWSVAYTYGVSKDVSNGIRNSWSSNYELNPTITPGSSPNAYSNFDLRHRIVAVLGGGFKWNDHNTSSIAFVYTGQSGSPYSLIYISPPFNSANNAPLPYIPKNQGDINLADIKDGSGNVTYSAAQQWVDLNNFIGNDKYLNKRRGQYAERNGLRTPWNHTLDMKIQHEFKFGGNNKQHGLIVSFDVFNVFNLINNNWGHITFVTNANNYTVNFLKFVKDGTGKAPGSPSTGYSPTFQFQAPPANGHYYTTDPINSRWQGQLGLKYSF